MWTRVLIAVSGLLLLFGFASILPATGNHSLGLAVVVGFVYFLPSLVGRNKRNARAILTLNALLGWTIVGWVIALVWANTSEAGLTA